MSVVEEETLRQLQPRLLNLRVAAQPTAIASNCKFVAAGGEGVEVWRWGGGGGCQLQGPQSVALLAWQPFNDNLLVTASIHGLICMWHVTDGLQTRLVRKQSRHTRRVEAMQFHPTVDELLLSAAADGRLLLWDMAADSILFEVEDWHASSLAWSPSGSQFVATSRHSHRLCLLDGRTGAVRKSVSLSHDGRLPPQVLFLGPSTLLTSGSSVDGQRQLAVHSLVSLERPLLTTVIDHADAPLFLFYDEDLRLLFLSGQGDSRILVYSISLPSTISFLTAFPLPSTHSLLCLHPKRGVCLSSLEVSRLLRVTDSCSIESFSLHAPEENGFCSLFYPPTRAATAALSLSEWRLGMDRLPLSLQLLPGLITATSKPVLFDCHDKLLTSDANNDLKFRFLTQVTKADYRSISEREDAEEVLKLEKVKQELNSEKKSVQQQQPEQRRPFSPLSPDPAPFSPNPAPFSISPAPFSLGPAPLASPSTDDDLSPTDAHISCLESEPLERRESPSEKGGSRLWMPLPVSRQPSDSSQCNGNGVEGESVQCRRERERTRLLENAVSMLEKHMRRAEARNERLQKEVEEAQEDIVSLRYEIEWKDRRISELQCALSRLAPDSPQ